MGVGTNSLILTVDEDPKPDMVLRIVEMLRHASLECAISLILQHSERG